MSAVALYWQRLHASQRAILSLWAVWLLGLFATAILCAIGVLPLAATIWLFFYAVALGGYQSWYLRSLRCLPFDEQPNWIHHRSQHESD